MRFFAKSKRLAKSIWGRQPRCLATGTVWGAPAQVWLDRLPGLYGDVDAYGRVRISPHSRFAELVDTLLHEALHLASDRLKLRLTELEVQKTAAGQAQLLLAALAAFPDSAKPRRSPTVRGKRKSRRSVRAHRAAPSRR